MSDTPDLDALAKRYLDLWQEELSRLAADKEVAEAMARTIELMNAGAARFAEAMRGGHGEGAAAGAAATRAARGGADAGVERLQARVAELEKRVRELERGRKPTAAKPKPKAQPRRRRRAAGAARKRRP